MLLEDLSLRMPGLEIRVSRNPKFEKNRKNDVFMHIIPLDSVLTTQMHFSPTHLVPLLLSTLFGGLASKLSFKQSKFYPTNSKNGINFAGGTGFSITTSTTASNQFCENTAHFPVETKYH